VLAQIFTLLSSDLQVSDDTMDFRIFWINGTAGMGKTIIAHTISSTCKECGILGASFFCSCDNADCSDPKLIFTTIAYQLRHLFPQFKDQITAVLRSNHEIGTSDLLYQLKELIVAPLCTLGDSFPSCVVVIDALNECKDDSTISMILASLSMHIAELSPLKFLIISRPQQCIMSGFTLESLDLTTRHLVLHEVELGLCKEH
jgi:NACHT domain